MNLRKEFDAILHQYGHYVLIVRTDRQTTCTCYNPTTGSVSKTCPYCFGLGTIPIIEKHITREKDLNVPETLPYLSTQQLFGEMAIATRGYFFKPEVVIQPHDLIIDVDWNGAQPIYSGRGLYEVSHVDKKSRTREITIVYNFIGAFDFTRAIENARNTSKKEQRTA